jgi:hypothetical protein
MSPVAVGGNNGLMISGSNITSGPITNSYGAVFNGSNYMQTSQSYNNPENFSVSLWFNTTNTGVGLMGFSQDQNNTTGTNRDRTLWIDNSGHLVWGVYTGQLTIITSPAAYNDGNWHQVVATIGPAGQQLYVDGALVASNTSATSAQDFTGYWHIGFADASGWPDSIPTPYFNGAIALPAITIGQLSTSQVSALYTAGSYTNYTSTLLADYPQDYWAFLPQVGSLSSVFLDYAQGHDTAFVNTGGVDPNGPMNSSAYQFSSATSTNAYTNQSVTPAANYSVGAWFKTTSGGTILGFTDQQGTTTPTNFDRSLWVDTAGNLIFETKDNLSTAQELTSSNVVNDGKWHFALADVTTNGTFLYVDGNQVASNSAISTDASSYPGYWHIGWGYSTGLTNAPVSPYFNGSLAQVFVAAPMTTAQVSSLSSETNAANLFASVLAAEIPTQYWPIDPLTNTGLFNQANTSSNFFINGFTDVLTGAGPLVGANYASFGPSVALATEQNNAPLSSTGTVGVWFNTIATGTDIVSNPAGMSLTTNGNGQVVFTSNGNSVTSTNSYDDGKWHYIAATYSPVGSTLYVDNAVAGSSIASFAPTVTSTAWQLAGSSSVELTDFGLYPTALSAGQISNQYSYTSSSQFDSASMSLLPTIYVNAQIPTTIPTSLSTTPKVGFDQVGDVTGNGYTLDLQNGGVINSTAFNGTGALEVVPGDSNGGGGATTATPITTIVPSVSFWFNAAPNATGTILNTDGGLSSIVMNSNGTINLIPTGFGALNGTTTSTYDDGKWHQATWVDFTPNGTYASGSMSLYIDGALVAQGHIGYEYVANNIDCNCKFTTPLTPNIALGPISIYGSILSPNQVTALAAATNATGATNLAINNGAIASWDMTDYQDGYYNANNNASNVVVNTPNTLQNDGSILFNGTTAAYEPNASTFPAANYSIGGYINTTSSGGVASFSDGQGSTTANISKLLWVDPSGKLVFGTTDAVNGKQEVASSVAVNDGKNHFFFVSVTPSGTSLSIDNGTPVTNTSLTADSSNFSGYWNFGYANATGYADGSSSNYLTGSLNGLFTSGDSLPASLVTTLATSSPNSAAYQQAIVGNISTGLDNLWNVSNDYMYNYVDSISPTTTDYSFYSPTAAIASAPPIAQEQTGPFAGTASAYFSNGAYFTKASSWGGANTSIGFWFKTAQSNAVLADTSNAELFLQNGKLSYSTFAQITNTSVVTNTTTSTATYNDNQWHFVLQEANPYAGPTDTYVDGNLAITSPPGGTVNSYASPSGLFFGADSYANYSVATPLSGEINGISYYPYSLKPAQIVSIYAASTSANATYNAAYNNGAADYVSFGGGSITPSAPVVSMANPDYLPLSGGVVTLYGTGIGAGTTVSMNGAAITPSSTTSDSLTFTAPAETTSGSYTVALSNSVGTGTYQLSYISNPTITNISPTYAAIGQTDTFTVTGTNLAPVLPVGDLLSSTATINGTTGTISNLTNTSFTLTEPAIGAGVYPLVYTVNGIGSAESSNITFETSPSLSSVSPSQYLTTSAPTALTINGNGLAGATVTVNGVAQTLTSDTVNALSFTLAPSTVGTTTNIVINTGVGTPLTVPVTYYADPTITNISPNQAPITGNVATTITGTGFLPSDSNSLYLVPANGGSNISLPINSITATSIATTLPSEPAGTYALTYAPAGMVPASSNVNYYGAPTISNITPTTVGTNYPASVTITGSLPGNGTITVDGVAATVTSQTVNSITFTMPSAGTAIGSATVTYNSSLFGSVSTSLNVVASPTITGITPTSLLAPGGQVTITGTGFQPSLPYTLTLTDPNGNSIDVTSGVSSITSTSIIATLPAVTLSGSYNVTYNIANVGSASTNITYNANPTISLVNPNILGYAGRQVTIVGSNFASSNYTLTLTNPSGAIQDITSTVGNITPTSMTATLPAESQAGTYTLSYTIKGLVPVTYQVVYEGNASITNISPSVVSDNGGTTVTITGSNFIGVNTVIVGNTVEPATANAAGTSLTFTTPSANVLSISPSTEIVVPLQVDGVSGAASSSIIYVPSPAITSTNPTGSNLTGGGKLVVNGTFFKITSVTLDNAPLTLTASGNNQLQATIPSASSLGITGAGPSTVNLVVNTQVGSATVPFVYYPVPVVVSSTPANLLTNLTSIKLVGTDLYNLTAVNFTGPNGKTLASNVTQSSTDGTYVVVTVPSGQALGITGNSGSVSLQVTNLGGSTTYSFTDYQALVVNSLNPSNLTYSGGVVNLVGSGTGNASTATISNGSTVVTVPVSSGQFTAPTASALGISSSSVVQVSVSITGNGGTAQASLSYYPTPTITQVSPSVENFPGGDTITITGTALDNATYALVYGSHTYPLVTSNATSTSAQFIAPSANVLGITSNTQMTVVATTYGGTSSSNFNYVATSSITSFSQNPISYRGGTLTINGSGFYEVSGVQFVYGTNKVSVTPATVSSTTLTLTAPNAVTLGLPANSQSQITVNVISVGSVATSTLTYNPASVITQVTPSTIPETSTTVTINGNGFFDVTSVDVTANGVLTNIIPTSVTPNAIVISTPPLAGLIGITPVTIQVIESSQSSNTSTITAYPAPSVTSSNPQGIGGNGGALTLDGDYLYSASSVTFTYGSNPPVSATPSWVDTAGASLSVNYPTASALGIPASATSSNVLVTVTTPGGVATYTITEYPSIVITSISPSNIPFAGEQVTINGYGLSSLYQIAFTVKSSGATYIAAHTSLSNTSVTFIAPTATSLGFGTATNRVPVTITFYGYGSTAYSGLVYDPFIQSNGVSTNPTSNLGILNLVLTPGSLNVSSTTPDTFRGTVGQVTQGNLPGANWEDSTGSGSGWTGTIQLSNFTYVGNWTASGSSPALASATAGVWNDSVDGVSYTVNVTSQSGNSISFSYSSNDPHDPSGTGTATAGVAAPVGLYGVTITFAPSVTYANGSYTTQVGAQNQQALNILSGLAVSPVVTPYTGLPAQENSGVIVPTSTTYGPAISFTHALLNEGLGAYRIVPQASFAIDSNSWAATYQASVMYSIVAGP